MPYITQEQRTELAFDRNAELPGELAFIIYQAVVDYVEQYDASFALFNEVVGVLENVKREFQRRYLDPYEDAKLEENGDI